MIIRLISGLMICMFVSSCGLFLVRKKDFELFREPIPELIENKVRFDGVYISENDWMMLYLYSNGTCKYMGYDSCFVQTPSHQELKSQTLIKEKDKERWGEYMIINDTLIVQSFNRHYFEKYKRWSSEKMFLIGNRDSILLVEWSSNYPEKNYKERFQMKFIFQQTALKPDSSKAWYLDRKWYTDGVHASRKTK
jgi:hypothetical protein